MLVDEVIDGIEEYEEYRRERKEEAFKKREPIKPMMNLFFVGYACELHDEGKISDDKLENIMEKITGEPCGY